MGIEIKQMEWGKRYGKTKSPDLIALEVIGSVYFPTPRMSLSVTSENQRSVTLCAPRNTLRLV